MLSAFSLGMYWIFILKLYYAEVFSVISKDIPVLYLTATNLNRLEHEMKLRYNDYIEKGIYC